MSLLVPISTLNPWQKIKMRDRETGLMVGGYVVVKHNALIAQRLEAFSPEVFSADSLLMLDGAGPKPDLTRFDFKPMPGATVVANQGQHRGATGWRFYTVPSTTLVQLDD